MHQLGQHYRDNLADQHHLNENNFNHIDSVWKKISTIPRSPFSPGVPRVPGVPEWLLKCKNIFNWIKNFLYQLLPDNLVHLCHLSNHHENHKHHQDLRKVLILLDIFLLVIKLTSISLISFQASDTLKTRCAWTTSWTDS